VTFIAIILILVAVQCLTCVYQGVSNGGCWNCC